MKNLFGIAFLSGVVALTAASCAESVETDSSAYEKLAFEAWMAKNGPADAVPQPNGMYVQFLEEGDPTDEGGATADANVWVRLNYTGTTLDKDVYATRSRDVALRQGIYTPKTYYAPDFLYCGAENVSMIAGRYYALKNELWKTADGSVKTKLYRGSKVRLYIPSTLAYGSSGYSDDQGYGGQYALDASRPVIEEFEIVEVFEDPIAREELLVKELAEGAWGLTDADLLKKSKAEIDEAAGNEDTEDDTPYFPHFYIDSMYRDLDAVPLDVETQLLTVDSTARVWYVGKFLSRTSSDEFIFDTNIEEVYDAFYYRQPGYEPDDADETRAVLSYKPADDKDGYVPAWYDMIPKMRRGRWYRVMFTSSYGYGASGKSAAMEANSAYYEYYMQMMMSSYMYGSSSYYGSSYYDSYYNPYYSDYSYLNYDDETGVITEIQPYTPLIFEIYIEPIDTEGVHYY
jgi:hypothetical protein